MGNLLSFSLLLLFLSGCFSGQVDGIGSSTEALESIFYIEDKPSGSGSSLNTINIDVFDPDKSFHAIVRNSSGDFVQAKEVSWVLVGDIGNLVIENSGASARLTSLKVGTGYIKYEIDGKTAKVDISITQTDAPPTISLIEPMGSNDTIIKDSSFSVQWTDSDLLSDASISLYYSNSNSGSCSTGTLITNTLKEDLDGASDSFAWDTTGRVPGDYYICANIDDGNSQVEAWSDVLKINDAPTISLVQPMGSNDEIAESGSFAITWTDSDSNDDAQISLYYSSTNSGSCSAGTLIVNSLSEDANAASGSYTWDSTGISDGTYYVCAIIDDSKTQTTSAWSDSLVINDKPVFSFTSPKDNDDILSPGDLFNITWTDGDSDNDASINLYSKNVNTGPCSTGTSLGTVSENSVTDSLAFSTNIASGTYYICATIDDGVNPPEDIHSDTLLISRTCTWAGTNTNWNSSSNWTNCNSNSPNSVDSVVIPTGATDYPLINSNTSILNFAPAVGVGGIINISSGNTFTVTRGIDAFQSSVKIQGSTNTCTDCELRLEETGGASTIRNSASVEFGKGLRVFMGGNSSHLKVGNGTEDGHLIVSGGSVTAEKTVMISNTVWGFKGFIVEGNSTNKSSVSIDGIYIHFNGGNNSTDNNTFEFENYYQIKQLDNIEIINKRVVYNYHFRSNGFVLNNCANGQFDDLNWNNTIFHSYYDQSTSSKGFNVDASNCTGVGPITMVTSSGAGFGSIYEKDPNNIITWQNDASFNCVWTGLTDTNWNTATNWSSCNTRSGVPDQMDTIRIPVTANQPILTGLIAVNEIATGVGGGSLTVADGSTLWVNTGNIKSDISFTGGIDTCTKCRVSATEFHVTNNAKLSLLRGIQLLSDNDYGSEDDNIFIGNSTSPGHFVANPGTSDQTMWPTVGTHYYYFGGLHIEGVDTANKSSVDINGLKFINTTASSRVNLELHNFYDVKNLDNIIFNTAFNWNTTGTHMKVNNCANATFTDTSWDNLDFVTTVTTGKNIAFNTCASMPTNSFSVTPLSGGSNLGYGQTHSTDPDALINWN